LFVPVQLLAHQPPYVPITATREGSYWNLVIPDALASGVITPGSAEANAALRYLLLHGSRLLGLLRFDMGGSRLPGYASSGSDNVYELSLERFLADNHLGDLLALTLYGQLAAGMTENTFVSGEGATIAPVPGERYRSMYLPPNSTSNASFLECLRLMLVHETRAGGLELGYGTPRSWLAAGKTIAVRSAPTTRGPVSFTIAARRGALAATVSPPTGARSLSLRLRLPAHERLGRVTVGGRPYTRVDRATATIDLSGLKGSIELTATLLGAS
jgi:hypothetical protein